MPDSHVKEESPVFSNKLANCQLGNYQLWQTGLMISGDGQATTVGFSRLQIHYVHRHLLRTHFRHGFGKQAKRTQPLQRLR